MHSLSQVPKQSWLTWFLRGIIIFGFLILSARLFELQILKGKYYRELAEGNRIRRVSITAPRGKILARGGEVLVGNEEIKKNIISRDQGFVKTTNIKDSSEIDLITEPQRKYRLGSDFAHLGGFLAEINENELGKIEGACSQKGPRKIKDIIGRGGLEDIYDCSLRGIDGEELIEVDAMGNKVRIMGRKKPIPGEDLKTSIDYGLQEKIAHVLEENKIKLSYEKAAVVATSKNGEVYAIYSTPSFDPNIFVAQNKDSEIYSVLNDKNLPLFNRAIGGIYHPGSVFKPVVALGALSEGKIDENFKYIDKGSITIKSIYGDYSYSNWYFTQYGATEGEIGVVKAIARSTDTFFYTIGELMGVDMIDAWAGKLNLDKVSGIDLTGEVPGLIPSPDWKMKVKGEKWYLGNTYHMSIGQGDLAVTPLGINTAISVIANDGKLCLPRIGIKPSCTDLEIKKEALDLIKEGMKAACTIGGTGYTFFDFKIKHGVDIACKTGTAEVNDVDKTTHAWFTLFNLNNDKEKDIVLTVMVEKGGEGSKIAGPIAREIMDYWTGRD